MDKTPGWQKNVNVTRFKELHSRKEAVNYIGFIQQALRHSNCMKELTFNLDMNMKGLMPHLVKLVRRRRIYWEKVSNFAEYKHYCKAYKLNSIRNYKDIILALKSAPSSVEVSDKKKEKEIIERDRRYESQEKRA